MTLPSQGQNAQVFVTVVVTVGSAPIQSVHAAKACPLLASTARVVVENFIVVRGIQSWDGMSLEVEKEAGRRKRTEDDSAGK